MRLEFARRYQCEGCGAEAQTPDFKPENWRSLPHPPGWLCDVSLQLSFREPFDTYRAADFCPDCAATPFEQLMKKTAERIEASRPKNPT